MRQKLFRPSSTISFLEKLSSGIVVQEISPPQNLKSIFKQLLIGIRYSKILIFRTPRLGFEILRALDIRITSSYIKPD